MFRKFMMVLATVLIAAVFVLPAAAQFGWGFGTPFGCGPFGIGGFGVGPFGTSFTSGFTTASSFTSSFSTVGGVGCGLGVPFGFGGLGCGLGGFGFGPFW